MTSTRTRRVDTFEIEVASCRDRLDVADPNEKVAKMLARLAFVCITPQRFVQRLQYRGLASVFQHHAVESLTVKSTAQVQVVFAWGAAGQRDFGDIRT